MDINQLSEIVKKKIKKGIEVQKIIIEDKTYIRKALISLLEMPMEYYSKVHNF